MILDELDIDAGAFAAETGWEIKPEGACKGDVCVPLSDRGSAGSFDVQNAADRLGMAVVHDPDAGLWAIGPETIGARALVTAAAPEIELTDVRTGEPFRLSSQRGRKVVLSSWAAY